MECWANPAASLPSWLMWLSEYLTLADVTASTWNGLSKKRWNTTQHVPNVTAGRSCNPLTPKGANAMNDPIRTSIENPPFLFCGIVDIENEENTFVSLFQDSHGRKFFITTERNYVYVEDVSEGIVKRI
jgi:hypothetical protein